MFHPCPKRLIHCDEIRAVHIPVFRYLEAHVVGAGQIARVVGLGSYEFMHACAIATSDQHNCFSSIPLLKYVCPLVFS